jgi:hypothetical protein
MSRRLNREDLLGSNPLMAEIDLHKPLYWQVYENYEILSSGEGIESPYIQAAAQARGREPKPVDVYDPVTDRPYLFLDFARIVERKDPDQVLMDWFHKYGLLGLTPRNPHYSKPLVPRQEFISQIVPKRRYDDRGGPGDYFELIWAIADEANESLVLYEAALGRDEQKLERILLSEYEPEHGRSRRQTLEVRAETSGANWLDTLVSQALLQVLEYTMGNINAFVYPEITFPQHDSVLDMNTMPPLTVNQLTRSWGARNLIGAMSLQFYWLITSASDLSHCKYCGRIISYAPPIPVDESHKGRKPRKDKEFCDSRCRQNYHYHNRIKPRRQSERR